MRYPFIISLLSCLLVSSVVLAQASKDAAPAGKRRVAFAAGANGAAGRKPVRLKSKKAGRADFSSALDYCDLTEIGMKDGKRYSRVVIPWLGVVGEPGVPEMPGREELVRIPAGASVALVVDKVSWQKIDGPVDLAPVQQLPPDVRRLGSEKNDDAVPFMKNAAVYSADEYANNVPVVLGDTGIIVPEGAWARFTVLSINKWRLIMSPELQECEANIVKLPLIDRAKLTEHLIASLDTLDDSENERLWLDEAERRYKEYKAGRISARPAAD